MPEYVPADYQHLNRRASLARFALFVFIILQLLGAVLIKLELDVFDRGRQGLATHEEFQTLMFREAIVFLARTAFMVIVFVFFVLWLYRAYRNLDALASPRRHRPGWAVGSWFVPILGFFWPAKIVGETWSGSEPRLDDRRREGAGLVWLWWGSYLVLSLCYVVVQGQVSAATTLDELRDAGSFWLATTALSVVPALLAMRVVRRVTERQEQRARVIGRASARSALAG